MKIKNFEQGDLRTIKPIIDKYCKTEVEKKEFYEKLKKYAENKKNASKIIINKKSVLISTCWKLKNTSSLNCSIYSKGKINEEMLESLVESFKEKTLNFYVKHLDSHLKKILIKQGASEESVHLILEKKGIKPCENILLKGYKIKKVEKKDSEKYIKCYKKASKFAVEPMDEWNNTDLKKAMSNKSNSFLAVTKKGNFVAVGEFTEKKDKISINNILVVPELRRKGLASMLIKNIINYAIEKNINKVELGVNSSNKPAYSFYKKMGFKKIRALHSKIKMKATHL